MNGELSFVSFCSMISLFDCIVVCFYMQLEVQVNDMRVQLECHAWENRELEKRLERAIREREMIETVFEEIEEAYEKAMDRIDVLENQVWEINLLM